MSNFTYVIFAETQASGEAFVRVELFLSLREDTEFYIMFPQMEDKARLEGWQLGFPHLRYVLLPGWWKGASREYLTAVKRCGGMP